MKIHRYITNKPQSLSFEIFHQRRRKFKNIDEMLEILCDCHPEYISVTFGAGGSSNNNKTIEIAKKIKNQYNVEPVVHLTCLCYNKAEIDEFTRQLSYEGIENILALRGDRNPNVPAKENFLHASDLIRYIKDTTGDQFCIAGACYPDIHPEAADKVDDIKNLKKKVDAETREDLNIMKQNTERLLNLTNQLLDFRKTESQGFRLNFAKCNITEVLKETHLRFTSLAKQKGLEFTLQLPETDFYAHVNQEAFTKIISNLLNNAVKYSEHYIHVSTGGDRGG